MAIKVQEQFKALCAVTLSYCKLYIALPGGGIFNLICPC